MKAHNHISAIGYYSGEPICGAEKQDTDNNCHLPYVADLDKWANQHIKCQDCINTLKEAGE